MHRKPTMTRPQRVRALVRLSLIGVLIIALLAIGSHLLSIFGLDDLTQEEIRLLVDRFGVWAPLAFTLVTFLQVTFVPIPFVVSILAGNMLFGFWGAFFYSLIGSVAGSLFAYSLGKWIGRPFVNWAFGDEDVVNHYLMKTQGKEFVVFFFMFLLPFFPDDALCALAGITALNRKQFNFIQLVARPTTILGNLLIWTGSFVPYSGIGLVIMVVMILVAAVGFYFSFKYADVINRYFNRFTEFVSMKHRSALNRYLHALRLHTSRKLRKIRTALARRLAPLTARLSRVFAPLIRLAKRTLDASRALFTRIESRLKTWIEERLERANAKKAEQGDTPSDPAVEAVNENEPATALPEQTNDTSDVESSRTEQTSDASDTEVVRTEQTSDASDTPLPDVLADEANTHDAHTVRS